MADRVGFIRVLYAGVAGDVGVGYPVLEGAIHGQYVVGLLLAFLAGKIIATSLTMAFGGSGGIFARSLFIGAMLGSAFGTGAPVPVPEATGRPPNQLASEPARPNSGTTSART